MQPVEPEPFSVTVVIPAYNESARIGSAIAAIRAQTEPVQEIIVVDDGSSDDTADVARALGVRVIIQANGGPASARNTGILATTSAWIAFCDGDDSWASDLVGSARAAHELRPDVGMIFADHRTDIDGRITMKSMFASAPEFSGLGVPLSEDIEFFERTSLARALVRQNFIAPSTIFVPRKLVVDNDIFFTPHLPSTSEYHVAEDIEWYLRLLSATDALAINRVMMTYYRHTGSISHNPGRVSIGNVMLGELIAAKPDRYAPGVAERYAQCRREHVRQAASDDFRSFRFASARDRFAQAQQLAWKPRDAVFGAVAACGTLPAAPWFAKTIRNVWHRTLKPSLLRFARKGR